MREQNSPPDQADASPPKTWAPGCDLWVWQTGLSPGLWRVLMALWSFADHGIGREAVVYPSRAKLRRRIGIGERAVRSKMSELRALGWIRDEPNHDAGELAIRLAYLAPRPDWISKPDQVIRKTGSGDPDQVIRFSGSGVPQDRIIRAAKPDRLIPHTPQPHMLTPQLTPHPESAAPPAGEPRPSEPHPEAPRSPTPDHIQTGKPRQPPIQDPLFELEPLAPKHREPTGAERVVEYFNQRKLATAEWAGLSTPSGITITTSARSAIEARIKDAGGGEAGILACKKVIDVQEAEARQHGRITATDPAAIKAARKAMKLEGGWKYWRCSTLFGVARNFDRRLERWDREGDHDLWGKAKSRQVIQNPGDPGQDGDCKAFTNAEYDRLEAKRATEAERAPKPPPKLIELDEGEIPF